MPSLTLTEKVRALPQELCDIIKNHVFEPTLTLELVTINKNYKPPTTLQASRSTRKSLAIPYYSRSIFFFHAYAEFLRWLRSLAPEYRGWVQHVRYDPRLAPLPPRHEVTTEAYNQVVGFAAELMRMYELVRLYNGDCMGFFAPDPNVRIGLRFEGEYEITWTTAPDKLLSDLDNTNASRWLESEEGKTKRAKVATLLRAARTNSN